MSDSYRNIRDDGVQKVANAAARLLLLPPNGWIVEQLDNNSIWAYNQPSNTWIQIGGSGLGTVTSVGLSLPASLFNVSGSPVTSAGTLTGSLKSQTQNQFFAAPDGAPGTPNFRAMVVADVPALPANQIPQATSTSDGYLTQTDWNTFNNKQPALGFTPANAAGQIFTGAISAPNLSGTNTGDVTLGTTDGLSLSGQVLSLGTASTSTTGALTSTDWNTFNSKQTALTFGSASTSTTGVTVTGTNATVGPAITVNVQTASGSQPGLLSATDWTSFNNKLNLSGGTMTGTLVLSADATVGLQAVSYQQFSGAINGLNPKATVQASPTINVTSLSGAPYVADGHTVNAGETILLQNQSTQSENGKWTVNVGAWTRTADMTTGSTTEAIGAIVGVLNGPIYGNRSFLQITDPATIGTDPLVFTLFNNNLYAADGTTLSLSGGNVFSINNGGVNDLQINNAAAIARSKLANGTNYTFVTNNATGVMQSTTVTASRAVATDANGLPTAATTTATELNFVSGVTSAIQTQLNSKLNLSGGTLTGAISESVSTLTYGGTISTNATLGNIFSVTLTGSTALLANPTGAVDGQTLIFRVIQDGTGGRLLTYGTNFKFGTLIPTITLSTSAGATDYIGVKYNAANSHFDVVSFNGGF